MTRTGRLHPLLALIVLALATTTCGEETPPPTALRWYVSETLAPRDTTLGTCAADDVLSPFTDSAARAHRWSVGTSITAIGVFDKPCGGWFGGPACTPITPTSIVETNSRAWAYTPLSPTGDITGPQGDFAGELHARAEGVGGVTATFEDRVYPSFELDARTARSLHVSRHLFASGKLIAGEEGMPAAVADGGGFTILIRPVDGSGERLCGRSTLTVSDGAMAAIDPRYPLAAVESNAPARIIAPHAASSSSSSSVTLGLGDAQVAVPFDVVSSTEIDDVDASLVHARGLDLVRLRAMQNGREVAGAKLRIEIVTTDARLIDEDAHAMPSSFETDRPAFSFMSATGRLRLTVSAVGSTLAPKTIDVAGSPTD